MANSKRPAPPDKTPTETLVNSPPLPETLAEEHQAGDGTTVPAAADAARRSDLRAAFAPSPAAAADMSVSSAAAADILAPASISAADAPAGSSSAAATCAHGISLAAAASAAASAAFASHASKVSPSAAIPAAVSGAGASAGAGEPAAAGAEAELCAAATENPALQHPPPRPPPVLNENACLFGYEYSDEKGTSSFFSTAAVGGGAAARAARFTLPPTLPPPPWLWDNSLLEAFAMSHASGAAADTAAAAGRAAAADRAKGFEDDNVALPASAALFLLPTSGGTILRLEEAYVCDSCCAVRAPEELSVEIEAYYCPSCFDSLTQAEALACGCCCTKCFDCPRCCTSLSVMRQPREAAAATAAALSRRGERSVADPAVSSSVADVFAVNEVHAVVKRLSEKADPSFSSDSSRDDGGSLSVDEAALLAAAAPQRCESLLSLSSEEEEEETISSTEEVNVPPAFRSSAAAAATARKICSKGGSSDLLSPLSSVGKGVDNVKVGDAAAAVDLEGGSGSQPQGEKKTPRGRRRERRYLYYFSCPYCRWDSQALHITSESSVLLPAAAIAEERAGGLLQRYFHLVMDVLQRAARDRERLRQLEARVKHKAVALLFAAAAAHGKRRAHTQQQQPLPVEAAGDAATAAAVGGATADAEGAGVQLLRRGSMQGNGIKGWRICNVERALAERAAQHSFAHADEAWAAAYRSDLQQPPQYVELRQLLRGEHALLQQQQEEKIMNDVLFGWQLQKHEAEQMPNSSRDSGGGGPTDGDVVVAGERKGSIDTAFHTPIAIPLHAPQLLLDRPSPDAPPLRFSAEHLRGNLLFTEPRSGETDRNGSVRLLGEWWTAEQATLEQRLRNPNSLLAAATSTSLLRPTRKKLLTRESKRCRLCTRYLVKAHVSSIAVPPFRINTAAALVLPWILPRISGGGKMLRQGEVTDLQLSLLNPTDVPLRLKFHFTHAVAQALPAMATPQIRSEHGYRFPTPAARAEVAYALERQAATVTGKEGYREGETESNLFASGALDSSRQEGGSFGAGDTLESGAYITASSGGSNAFAGDLQQAKKKEKRSALAEGAAANWETLEIVTPDFEVQLDRYDDILGEFGDFDLASTSSKSSSRASSHNDGFSGGSISNAAVEWKKGNSAQVRVQVQAKSNRATTEQHWPAVCCVTIDVETAALQSNAIRLQYLLFLGHVRA